MPRILHLVPDEKFIPFTQTLYEVAFPGNSRFRVFGVSKESPPKFVRLEENVECVSKRYLFSAAMNADLQWCDCLVIHYMTPWLARAVMAAPPTVTVAWIPWGGDFYYLLPAYAQALHLPQTRQIVARLQNPFKRFMLRPKMLLQRIGGWLFGRIIFRGWEKRIASRIDLASMLAEEHGLLTASLAGFRAHLLLFNWYYSVEHIFMQGPPAIRGQDVLVGNSAHPTNNHADAFALLRRLDLSGRKIVVPLSYGDDAYADEICRIGSKLFGSRFFPLRQFMPIDEYNEVISTCATVLMNQVRQQAFGTVCTALYKGAKVYMRPESLLLSFLREKGALVHDMPDHAVGDEEFFTPMTEQEIGNNRAALFSFLSFDKVVENARRLSAAVAENRSARR